MERGSEKISKQPSPPLEYKKKKKPVSPENYSEEAGFLFSNGGGGGSRTRVQKCSPFVSTCLVPGFKFRIRGPAGTRVH